MASLVVTVVGNDRPGPVGRISDVVRTHAGNWLESRMSHLGDQFAGIVLVEVNADNADGLVKELTSLEGDGLLVTVKHSGVSADPSREGLTYSLNVVGNDRPGIVREVTQVLIAHSVNVEDLNTNCGPAPHAGGAVFRAIPLDASIKRFAVRR